MEASGRTFPKMPVSRLTPSLASRISTAGVSSPVHQAPVATGVCNSASVAHRSQVQLGLRPFRRSHAASSRAPEVRRGTLGPGRSSVNFFSSIRPVVRRLGPLASKMCNLCSAGGIMRAFRKRPSGGRALSLAILERSTFIDHV